MTTYFIDFQNGCDENDGLRPETPFRTQHPELLQPDDTVLFRRGSVFRGPLQNPSGRWEHPIHYGAYGEGEPPCSAAPKAFPTRHNGKTSAEASGGLPACFPVRRPT